MKMLAAVLYELGKPLEIEELTIPNLTRGQVLVKIACSGVCRSQLMEVRGLRGFDKYLPHLLGHEGSGTVVEVGAGVSKVKTGDRIVLTWIKSDGMDCPGAKYLGRKGVVNSGPVTTFNEYSIVSENRCVKISDNIPMDVASLLGCAVPTGAGIVLNSMCPDKDSNIAIWGVGGVGLSAVMGAKICGCNKIVAIDMMQDKLEMAKKFGATNVINSSECEPLTALLLTCNGGVDYAVEAAGRTETIENAFRSVRKNGGLCILAGHPPSGEMIQLDPYELICGKQIRGSWGGESKPDRDIPLFSKSYIDNKLPLDKLITHRFLLQNINEALSVLESGKAGRVIIEIGRGNDK